MNWIRSFDRFSVRPRTPEFHPCRSIFVPEDGGCLRPRHTLSVTQVSRMIASDVHFPWDTRDSVSFSDGRRGRLIASTGERREIFDAGLYRTALDPPQRHSVSNGTRTRASRYSTTMIVPTEPM